MQILKRKAFQVSKGSLSSVNYCSRIIHNLMAEENAWKITWQFTGRKREGKANNEPYNLIPATFQAFITDANEKKSFQNFLTVSLIEYLNSLSSACHYRPHSHFPLWPDRQGKISLSPFSFSMVYVLAFTGHACGQCPHQGQTFPPGVPTSARGPARAHSQHGAGGPPGLKRARTAEPRLPGDRPPRRGTLRGSGVPGSPTGPGRCRGCPAPHRPP